MMSWSSMQAMTFNDPPHRPQVSNSCSAPGLTRSLECGIEIALLREAALLDIIRTYEAYSDVFTPYCNCCHRFVGV